VIPFKNPCFHYSKDDGFIVWRMGTGMNVELLHIRAAEPRNGQGTKLFGHMLNRLEKEPHMTPYHSVYGFTRLSNERAVEFYRAMGFNFQYVNGLYQEGEAILFWQGYTSLKAVMESRTK